MTQHDKPPVMDDDFFENLLADEDIADDGFSVQVVQRINRQSVLRRWVLGLALFAGLAISIMPMIELIASLSSMLSGLRFDLPAMPGLTELLTPTLLLPLLPLLLTVVFLVLEEQRQGS